ncbi:MAG: hypothetical protein WCB11_28860 [Terriglobales bacterium]
MSMDEYEDCFVFRCDGCGLTAQFQRGGPGSFMACVGEIKDRGWRIGRDQYGDWDHRCGRCKAKASADLLNKPFGGSKLQRVK